MIFEIPTTLRHRSLDDLVTNDEQDISDIGIQEAGCFEVRGTGQLRTEVQRPGTTNRNAFALKDQQRVRIGSRERSWAAGVAKFFDNECVHAFSM